MRAAVFRGGGRTTVAELDCPEPGAGEVLLKLEGSGICASNLPAWQGRSWFEYPLAAGAPGHEPWGRIVAAGEGVGDLEIGQRVTGLSFNAYAEFDVARAEHLVPLPPRFDAQPFPGEALACAMNILRRAVIGRDMPVAVVGAGFLGNLLIQAAAAAGARVTAWSCRAWSLAQAREQGASELRDLSEGVNDADRGRYARVIECTGTQQGLDAASALTGVGGRLVIAGYHQDGKREVDLQEWNWKGIDVINAHERDPARYVAGMRAAIEAIDAGLIDPWPLFTHRHTLDDIDGAFEAMQNREHGFTKAVLCF